MEIWLNALHSGKAISAESYKAMTTDYSNSIHYGYALCLELFGGVGHGGSIGIYNSYDYINEDNDFILFMVTNNLGSSTLDSLFYKLVPDLMEEFTNAGQAYSIISTTFCVHNFSVSILFSVYLFTLKCTNTLKRDVKKESRQKIMTANLQKG